MSWSAALAHIKRPVDLIEELTEFTEAFVPVRTGDADRDLQLLQQACHEKLRRAIGEIKDLQQTLRRERHQVEELRRHLDDAQQRLENKKGAETAAWLHS